MTVPFVDTRRLLADDRAELLTAFARVLDSGVFVQGPEVEALEEEFASQYGTPFAVAVNSGTAALHLALQAHNIGAGDEVILPGNTFIATAEAVTLAGATPVFADIEPDGFNIDPDDAARRITSRTKAIIAVHLYGKLAQIDRLSDICQRHDVTLLEDACQAHGARSDGRAAGTFGGAGCLSFYPTKNVGAIGEGGMLLTADAGVAERAKSLRNHGQGLRYEHLEPGYNYRMSELQAAALRVVGRRLDEWNQARRQAADWYRAGLTGSTVLPPAPDPSHVYHLFVVRSRARSALQNALSAAGIHTAIHYPTPVHLQQAYHGFGDGVGSLPRTEAAVSEILSLPMHPKITRDEVDAVCAAIRKGAAP